ncbi:hypothetical protein MAM1_0086c04724 [Mucor ambiguus]|uniref:Uncharacterized protein n=1 Tax=Mucor ambiguus TaxID=91626 RepID=A0A0C9LUL9_9FUNG|nr:hypothetical protein MAM1_0086c04724 [Mucor ambiguus]
METIYIVSSLLGNNNNVFTAFFEQKFRASTIQSTVVIETTIKVLDHHVNTPLNIATYVSFNQDKNEGGKGGTANTVEANKVVINDHHAEQQAVDNVALPPTAK